MKLFTYLVTLSVTILSLSLSSTSLADDEPPKTKVVCFGDSITKRGYDQILAKALNVDTVMSGVAGHSTAQALRRMQKDVIDHNPDIVVIFFGTNDLRVDAPRVYVTLKDYKNNLETMIKASEKAGAKVVLCTLPPINIEKYFTRHEKDLYEKQGGLEKMINNYRHAAIEVSEKHKVPLVDLNQELKKTPKWMSPDGVHPSQTGTRIIAELIIAKVKPLLP
ncbi:MAG: SGNH/GDSL hydrolase family protein [Akkermansiaceae bacterium]